MLSRSPVYANVMPYRLEHPFSISRSHARRARMARSAPRAIQYSNPPLARRISWSFSISRRWHSTLCCATMRSSFCFSGPRGVLSASSFPGYLVIIDYAGKRIKIQKGELPPADSRTIFQYTAEQILPNVPIRIGSIEVRAHPDTGSPGGLTLGSKYMQELPLASEPVEVGRARTPGGEFPVHSAKVEAKLSWANTSWM